MYCLGQQQPTFQKLMKQLTHQMVQLLAAFLLITYAETLVAFLYHGAVPYTSGFCGQSINSIHSLQTIFIAREYTAAILISLFWDQCLVSFPDHVHCSLVENTFTGEICKAYRHQSDIRLVREVKYLITYIQPCRSLRNTTFTASN